MKKSNIFMVLVLVVAMLFCMTSMVFAAETQYDVSANQDGSVVAIFNDSTGKLTIRGTGATYDYDESTIVTSIPTSVLQNTITLEVEEGVTTIGNYLFYRLSGSSKYFLENCISVKLPSTLTSIGEYAFYNASKITRITIPESVNHIGANAFKECAHIDYFTYTGDCTDVSFGSNMGWNAKNRIAILSSSNEAMINYLTSLRYKTMSSSTIEFDVSKTGDGSVMAVYDYTTNTLTVSGNGPMKDFLSNDYDRPMKDIIENIVAIEVEEGVTSIGESFVFYDAGRNGYAYPSKLTSVQLPSTLTSIGDYAFQRATALKTITLPANITKIGYGAFNYTGLTDIYNLSEQNQTIRGSAFYPNSNQTFYLYRANTNGVSAVPSGKTIVYLDDNTIEYSGTLDNGVTWEYDPATQTITFGGTGSADVSGYFSTYGKMPWSQAFGASGGATNWVFGNGITGASSNIFNGSSMGGASIYAPSSIGSQLSAYAGGGASVSDLSSLGGGSGTGTGSGSGSDNNGQGGTGGNTSGDGDTELPEDKGTMIIVDAEPTMFCVTVPIAIHVEMDASGVVTVDGDYTVDNKCAMGPVLIEDIYAVSHPDWTISDFDADYSNMKASSNQMGLMINGVKVGTDGSIVLNDDLSSVIRHLESKDLFFEAKLPAQKVALDGVAAMGIVFTVDFDKI